MRKHTFVLLCALPALLRAQTPAETLEKYRKQWPDQAALFLHYNTVVELSLTRNGVEGKRSVEQERLALKPPAGQSSGDEVGYSSLVPLEKIEAWIMVPKDDSYKKVRVEDITHRDERSDNVFHDDSKVASFTYHGMTTGAITHLEYTLGFPDARMIAGHYFASGYPVEESSLTVITDKGVEVEARAFHMPEGALEHQVTTEHGKTVQRWTMKNLAGSAFEDNAPSYAYHIPHIQLIV
ncbi:MAG TPA: DUF3857 domain-containing protein, partial [Flavobacteriales bacterium]|nr:DUF3857 domain-containing protein [Flavobacteriales bacterium]